MQNELKTEKYWGTVSSQQIKWQVDEMVGEISRKDEVIFHFYLTHNHYTYVHNLKNSSSEEKPSSVSEDKNHCQSSSQYRGRGGEQKECVMMMMIIHASYYGRLSA